MLDDEIWKPFPDLPSYEVSNLGRVRSQTNGLLGHGWRLKSPTISNKGLVVGLTGHTPATMTLQRLVALVWLGPSPSARHKWIAFKDGNHNNYRADNLEWTDVSPTRGASRRAPHSWEHRARLSAALRDAPHESTVDVARRLGADPQYASKLTLGVDYVPRDRASPSSTAFGTPPIDATVEEWRAIPAFVGYDVSSFGRVRSWHGLETRLLSLQSATNGYMHVTIAGKTVRIHRLVAVSFCTGQSADRDVVNHKDGDRTNNYFENLEWLSAQENSKHAHASGLWKQGDSHGQRIRRPPVSMYAAIRLAVSAGATAEALAKQNDWDVRVVACLAAGNAWANEDASSLPDERWQAIPGSKHEVSSHGRVRRAFNGKLLKPSCADGRYPTITIPFEDGWRTVKVHRLVAGAFVPRREDVCAVFVNHKDGDKENNHHANLEWVTPAENAQHAHNTGLVAKALVRSQPTTTTTDSFPRKPGEDWRGLPEPGYFISNLGRVASTWQSFRLLVPRGRFVKVDGRQRSIADLVAWAFLSAPPSPRHLPVPMDGDVNNYAASNLEWGTQLPPTNRNRTRRLSATPLGGTGKGTNRGMIEGHPNYARIIQQVVEGAMRPSTAARMFGVTCSAVTKAARRYLAKSRL